MTLLQLRFHTFYKHLPWYFEMYNPVVIDGGHKMVTFPYSHPQVEVVAKAIDHFEGN